MTKRNEQKDQTDKTEPNDRTTKPEQTPDLENGESFNKGYVKLYRSILDNPWLHENPNRLSVYIHLLLLATHQRRTVLFGGENVILDPGQLVTGRKALSKMTGIDESTVHRIMKSLKSEHLIEQQTSSKNRLVSMVCWQSDQESEHLSEQQANNKRTTDEHQLNNERTHTRMIENEKKEKNINNEEEEILHGTELSSSFINTSISEEEEEEEGNRISANKDSGESGMPITISDNQGLTGVPANQDSHPPDSPVAPPPETKQTKQANQSVFTEPTVKRMRELREYMTRNMDTYFVLEWADIHKSNYKTKLNDVAITLSRFYHDLSKYLGHNLKTDWHEDVHFFFKQLEYMWHWTGMRPTRKVIVCWIVWYLAGLPKNAKHPDGLYPTAFFTSWDKFAYWAHQKNYPLYS